MSELINLLDKMIAIINVDLYIVIIPHRCLPCEGEFTVNGLPMDKSNFGYMTSDPCPEGCDGYDCHDMHFVPYDVDVVQSRLNINSEYSKYHFTKAQILNIQERLESEFYVGDCGWCV